MGREARRAQGRAERRASRDASRSNRTANKVSAPRSPNEQARSKGSLLKPAWVMDIINELKKVTWPSRQEVGYLSFVVIVVSLIIGTILGVADLGFGWFIENTILR